MGGEAKERSRKVGLPTKHIHQKKKKKENLQYPYRRASNTPG